MNRKFAERSQLNLSELNEEVLADWLKENLFERSVKEREGCPSFVFYNDLIFMWGLVLPSAILSQR